MEAVTTSLPPRPEDDKIAAIHPDELEDYKAHCSSRADSPSSNTEEFEMIEPDNNPSCQEEDVQSILSDLECDYEGWLQLRQETVSNLRAIADYIDSVSKKSGIAKAIGSGSGALAGGLTLIGGALTIVTGGVAAVPVLLAGTGLGLAAGVGGGAAAVTEKIVKSRQMKAARQAIEADAMATAHLQNRVRLKYCQLVVSPFCHCTTI